MRWLPVGRHQGFGLASVGVAAHEVLPWKENIPNISPLTLRLCTREIKV